LSPTDIGTELCAILLYDSTIFVSFAKDEIDECAEIASRTAVMTPAFSSELEKA